MRSSAIGLLVALVLALPVAGRHPVAAAIDPHVLGLRQGSLPAGAFITHEHLDLTAAAVDAEGIVGSPTTQGNYYRQLHFGGSLFESARLPNFHGAGRQVWLLATIFPSASAAAQALAADATFDQCDVSPIIPSSARTVTCSYVNPRGPESGMYALAVVGNAEFIVLGFVRHASLAARTRAEKDATYVALQEIAHVRHVLRVTNG
jgi:hypothetical protein